MKELYNDACFETFTPEQLEGMRDLVGELPAGENKEALLRLLEVLEEQGREAETKKAWEEFQTYYNIPEGKGMELYETGDFSEEGEVERAKKKVVSFSWLRAVGRVAAVAAITAVLMVTAAVAAQAAGYDVFGVLGRWTDEKFQFDFSGFAEEETGQYESEIQDVLQSFGISEELVPAWHPKGFEPNGCEKSVIRDSLEMVVYGFDNEKEGKSYTINIGKFYDKKLLENLVVEKNDEDDVETYVKNNRRFYVMLNNFGYVAAWTDGETLISIGGNLSKREIKNIIDSIGG